MRYVRDEKDRHYNHQLDKLTKEPLPEAEPLQADRPDRLFDMCLFFITPHCFTPLDEQFIVELAEELLVIPICAKADAMTQEERVSFQTFIRDRLACSMILPEQSGCPCLV